MPSEWVVRRIDDDYGVDLEVEIFEGGEATSLTFKVQLKSTDASNLSEMKRSIQRSSLEYWRDLDVPVLICLWSAGRSQMFARWAHGRVGAPKDSNSKSVTVRFRADDLLSSSSWKSLLSNIVVIRRWKQRLISVPLLICINSRDGVETPEVSALFNIELRKLTRPLDALIRVTTQFNAEAIQVELTHKYLTVELPSGTASMRLHLHEEYLTSDLSGFMLANDALMAIAILLGWVGWSSESASLGLVAFPSSPLMRSPEVALDLAITLAKEGRRQEAAGLLVTLLEQELDVLGSCAVEFLMPVIRQGAEIDDVTVGKLLALIQSKANFEFENGNSKASAEWLYNMSQIKTPNMSLQGCLDALDKAVTRDTSYLDRSYYHKERAGILWELGKFDESATAYKRCLALGSDTLEVTPLLGDALLHAGKYAESQRVCRQDHEYRHNLKYLNLLNFIVAGSIIDILGLDNQARREILVEERTRLDGLSSPDEQIETILDLLKETDALNPVLWMRLAMAVDDIHAFRAMVIAALGFRRFPHAWATAVSLGLKYGALPDEIDCIIDQGAYWCGDEFQEAVEELALSKGETASSDLLTKVYRFLAEREADRPPFVVRLGGEQYEL